MQTNPNIPPSTVGITPALPQLEAWQTERLNLRNGTRTQLGGMRDSLTAVGMIEGVLTLPITLIKKMFQPILSH